MLLFLEFLLDQGDIFAISSVTMLQTISALIIKHFSLHYFGLTPIFALPRNFNTSFGYYNQVTIY